MIDSCKGCLPPKRTPTCKFDGTCDKYAIAKEKHDKEKEAQRLANKVKYGILNQRSTMVRRALKKKGIRYGETNNK